MRIWEKLGLPILLLWWLFSITSQSWGQYRLYLEDFSSQNGKGIYGPTPTTDLSGVNWSIDASASSLTASDDYAKVVSELFEYQDTNGKVIFESPFTPTSGFSGFSYLVDLSESGDLEASDRIEVEYSIDGGTTFSSGTVRNGNFSDDLISDSINQSIANGPSVGFRIEGNSDAAGEYLRFDQLQLHADTIKGANLIVDASNQSDFLGDLDFDHGSLYLSDGITYTHGLNFLSNAEAFAYEEDFTGQDGKGISGTGTDTTGVNWSLSKTANLTDEFDYLKVVTVSGNEIFEFRDLSGGTGTWTSPLVDISTYTNLNLAMELAEVGDQEPSDQLLVEYSLDGGATFSTITTQTSDFTSYSLHSAIANGSQFQLRVTANNSADEEKHRIDDLALSGHAPAIIGDQTGGKSVFAGSIDLGRAVDLAASTGGRISLDGILSGSAKIHKTGGGIVAIHHTSTNYSGNMVIEEGKLEIGQGVSISGQVSTEGALHTVLGGDGSVGSATFGSASGEVDRIVPGLGLSSSSTSLQQLVSLNDKGTASTADDGEASIGALTVSNLTMNQGGVYDWEIKDFDGNTPGTDWDVLSFSTLSLGDASSSFTLNLLPLQSSDGTAGAPANTSDLWSASGKSFKFLDGPDGGTGITWGDWSTSTINEYFVIRSDGFAYQTNFYYGDWSVSYANGDFYLNFSAVPEPSTLGIISLFTGLIFLKKRDIYPNFLELLAKKSPSNSRGA